MSDTSIEFRIFSHMHPFYIDIDLLTVNWYSLQVFNVDDGLKDFDALQVCRISIKTLIDFLIKRNYV